MRILYIVKAYDPKEVVYRSYQEFDFVVDREALAGYEKLRQEYSTVILDRRTYNDKGHNIYTQTLRAYYDGANHGKWQPTPVDAEIGAVCPR